MSLFIGCISLTVNVIIIRSLIIGGEELLNSLIEAWLVGVSFSFIMALNFFNFIDGVLTEYMERRDNW